MCFVFIGQSNDVSNIVVMVDCCLFRFPKSEEFALLKVSLSVVILITIVFEIDVMRNNWIQQRHRSE